MMADKKVPLKGLRGMIATNMLKSLQQSAQLTFVADANVAGLFAAREQTKKQGLNIGIEDFILKALVETLHVFPMFNGTISDSEIELKDSCNIAVATPIPGGLAAPILANLNDKSLQEISQCRRTMIAKAKAGKLSPREMVGGTFTISNLGQSRVKYFTPVIHQSQLAILGIGAISKCPIVNDNDEIDIAPFMSLSMTCDHRAIDGQPAATFLTALIDRIEMLDIKL
jgi:pyruvate dehydrogenase E2 component (dihydrolipoamide acetyltransferase)